MGLGATCSFRCDCWTGAFRVVMSKWLITRAPHAAAPTPDGSRREEESQIPGAGNSLYSEDTSREIDEEVRRIVDECYGRATQILEDNLDILHAMKDALMEYETIDSEQVDDLMARKPVRPPHDWHDGDFGSSSGGSSGQTEGAEKNTGDSVGDPASDH